jgi:hypothetical protein
LEGRVDAAVKVGRKRLRDGTVASQDDEQRSTVFECAANLQISDIPDVLGGIGTTKRQLAVYGPF